MAIGGIIFLVMKKWNYPKYIAPKKHKKLVERNRKLMREDGFLKDEEPKKESDKNDI